MCPSPEERYVAALEASQFSAHDVEPEAQLTRPVADLFEEMALEHALGELRLWREAQLPGVRPDFAATLDGRACGWIELKAPGRSVDGSTWRGRERTQWAGLSELDALIVCNGEVAKLYRLGEPQVEAALPNGSREAWQEQPLVELLQLFVAMRPPVITRVSQLAKRLAPMARLLRDRALAGLTAGTRRPVIAQAKAVWAEYVHEGASDAAFANDLAQVTAYSLAIAALQGGADTDGDSLISLTEARDALREGNSVLAAALGPVLEVEGLRGELENEISAIERLVSVVDIGSIRASRDPRGEAWLWFYEDFLAAYDPVARQQAGVYYTPTDIVQMQVRHVDHILRSVFGRADSFGDRNTVTLDPATGSGTYPLAVLDQAAAVATEQRGAAGPQQVVRHLTENLLAFELLPGPYAVAHLRVGQRLAELAHALLPPGNVRVYLTDTLDDPSGVPSPATLWGDAAVLAQERERARTVKSTQPVTVVIGNPPYERGVAANGGWVVNPTEGRALFADVIEPAQHNNVMFSAQASLYNHYIYFWRWALWKAFQQSHRGPAVVSFITASSWLKGPAFVGLRQLARDLADEMWIVDLGGEGRGASTDENVFAIQTPVAVVTLFRKGSDRGPAAEVYYRRVEGTRADKLAQLSRIRTPAEDPEPWAVRSDPSDGRLIPVTGGVGWQSMPLLTDLLPWQQPGAMLNRTWPIAPEPETLKRRWRALLAWTDADDRAEAFVTARTGRNIHTSVAGLAKISELRSGAPHKEIVRYGYRSFDLQWTFEDPRLANLERPALWRSLSDQQLFLSTMTTTPLGAGPALTVTTAVPDKHHFRGSYGGKDVIPLYRDKSGAPNVTPGLLDVLTERLAVNVSAEDFVAYVYALLAHPGYHSTFASEMQTPGPRVPITADSDLFQEAVATGRRLLSLHTFGTRYSTDSSSPADEVVPRVPGIEWTVAVTGIPASMEEISYDPVDRCLHVGDGRVSGVIPTVWEFSVSGWPVVQRWLGARTRRGIGRAATSPKPLDLVRPEQWVDEWNQELLRLLNVLTHTIEGAPSQAGLLDRILEQELIQVDDLPMPNELDRGVPDS